MPARFTLCSADKGEGIGMEQQQTISHRQFAIIVAWFMVGTSILITPAALATEARQDAWIACILGVGINALLVLLYTALGRRFGGSHLTGYCEQVLGPWAGKLAGVCFTLFFYLLAALMVGDLGYFLTSQVMPETPIEVVQMLFIVVIVMAIYGGLRVYGRAGEFFFPIMLALLLVLLVPLLSKFRFQNLAPLLESGFRPIARGAFSFFSLQELVVLLMIYPYITKGKNGKSTTGKSFMKGVLLGGSLLFMVTLFSIGVLGPSLTANQLFPAYTLAKNINIGQFFQRVEGMMIFIWVLSIFVKIAVTFHASLLGMAQLLKLGDMKPFVIPLSFGLIVLSLACYPNALFIQQFLSKNWTPFALIFMLYLPLLLLGASFLRGRKRLG